MLPHKGNLNLAEIATFCINKVKSIKTSLRTLLQTLPVC